MTRSNEEEMLLAVVMDESTTFTLVEVCERCHLEKEILLQMIDYGLIEPVDKTAEHIFIDLQALHRVETAMRLQHDLDINLAGAALVLELLDELDEAHSELAILRRHVGEDAN